MNLNFSPSKIEKHIKEQGLKINAVAEWLNISPSYLSRKLKGKRHFRPEELGLLAARLQVDIKEFYEERQRQAD
ncbi:MAG: helix-turn-helix domain-containing protein [Candidatus Poribacteria bacterium]